MQKISFRAMGCQMLAVIDSPSPRATRRLEQVPGWFESWEQRLSRFRPESELSQVNQRSGEEVPISAVLREVLQAAQRMARFSGGLVTPTILDALETAGYDRSFDLLSNPEDTTASSPGAAQVEPASSPPLGRAKLALRCKAGTLRLAAGVRLDLGGVAKGWSADRAAHRLRRHGPALVDAGGDIAVNGPMTDGEPWPVSVTDPLDPHQRIDLLLLYRGGVATSGRDYRRWRKGPAWQHHIIDPRSGLPAQTDVLSATVVAPSAQAAETAAKTTLILGSWAGLAWLDQRTELAGMVVLENGEALYSRRWINYIERPYDSNQF